MHTSSQSTVFPVLGVVTKKPKEMKTAWISGRVNQASLKLYAGFPNTVCWTSYFFCKLLDLSESEKRNGFCPHFVQLSNSVFIRTIRLLYYCLPFEFLSFQKKKNYKTVCHG